MYPVRRVRTGGTTVELQRDLQAVSLGSFAVSAAADNG